MSIVNAYFDHNLLIKRFQGGIVRQNTLQGQPGAVLLRHKSLIPKHEPAKASVTLAGQFDL